MISINVNLLGHQKKRWTRILSAVDWTTVQEYYNKPNTLKDVCKMFSLSSKTLKKADVVGLFKKDNDRRYKQLAKTKEKLSRIRKKFLKENPDQHPWRKHDRFISVPCEKIKKDLLSKNITFVEEHKPLESRFFSIDIAFPNEKIGIEINGNQHYNKDGTLKEYYQNRHDLIVQSGWTIHEIHYLTVYNDKFIDELCSDVSNLKLSDYTGYVKKAKKKLVYNCQTNGCDNLLSNKRGNLCLQCYRISTRKVTRPPYDQLLQEIKDTNYSAVGRKYGVSDNSIRNWVKTYERGDK